MPKPPIVSSQYEYRPEHWWFTRDTKLPRNAFPLPLRERIAEWCAVAIIALSIAGAIVLSNYMLF
jgi:hypothetical protein